MDHSQYIIDQLFSQQAPITPNTPRLATVRQSGMVVHQQKEADGVWKNVTNSQQWQSDRAGLASTEHQQPDCQVFRAGGLVRSQVFDAGGPDDQIMASSASQAQIITASVRINAPHQNLDTSMFKQTASQLSLFSFTFMSKPTDSNTKKSSFMFKPTASQQNPPPFLSRPIDSQRNPTPFMIKPTDSNQNQAPATQLTKHAAFSFMNKQIDSNQHQTYSMFKPIVSNHNPPTYLPPKPTVSQWKPSPFLSNPTASHQNPAPNMSKPNLKPTFISKTYDVQKYPTPFKFKSTDSQQNAAPVMFKPTVENETPGPLRLRSAAPQDPSSSSMFQAKISQSATNLTSKTGSQQPVMSPSFSQSISTSWQGTSPQGFGPPLFNSVPPQQVSGRIRATGPQNFVSSTPTSAANFTNPNEVSAPQHYHYPTPVPLHPGVTMFRPPATQRTVHSIHKTPPSSSTGRTIIPPQKSQPLQLKSPSPNQAPPPPMYQTQPSSPISSPCTPTPSLSSLHPVSALPPQFQPIFSQFTHFNQVQSEVLPDILNTDHPVVVASPTGSGKTVLFELAIVRLLDQMQSSEVNFKVVYIAPIKALCSERYRDWMNKFSPLGVRVVEVTGDKEGEDVEDIRANNVIITTPEKWDAVSRWLSMTDPQLIFSLKLLLIDEVHLLNDKDRGHVLEAVVCRLKTLGCPARYVAVSATFPNVEDIAFWLGGFECVFFKFGEEVRPVTLKRVVLGYHMYEGHNEFRFEMNLSYKLDRIIQEYGESMPTLVFCNSRKSTINTCTVLAKQMRVMAVGEKRNQLLSLASRLGDSKLKMLVTDNGVGYHHAGLVMEDRRLVEQIFSAGLLPVLTCTSTLAMGVNLPAHLVVIKSTQQMVAGAWREYSESQVLQMAGRAGRPQFCDSATVVIMTEQGRKKFYDSLIEGNTMVESNLHSHLFEHLNAEIILGTIRSVAQATDWIKSTYLYLRVRRNPTYYDKSEDMSTDQLEDSMYEMCLEALKSMAEVGLITMTEDGTVGGSSLGKLMSRFYLAFSTMKQLTSVKGMETMVEMLGVICRSRELSEAVLRINERKTLNSLNKNKEKNIIRFPLEGKIKTKDMKVNVLIQASLGSMHIPDPGLNMEIPRFVRLANRIATCLVELVMNDVDNSKNFTLVKNSLCLLKSLNCGIWDDSKFVAKQMDKVGLVLSTALVKGGFTSFSKLSVANPRLLELAVNKAPPFGNSVRDFALGMPQYKIEVRQGDTKLNSVQVDILVRMVNREVVGRRTGVEHGQHRWVVLVGNGNNRVVATFRGSDTLLLSGHSVFQRSVRLTREEWEDKLEVRLISLTVSGVDTSCVLHLSLPGVVQTTAFASNPPSLSQLRRACKHSCGDKQACAHPCCKAGVMTRKESAGFMDNIHLIRSAFKDKFNSSVTVGEGSSLRGMGSEFNLTGDIMRE